MERKKLSLIGLKQEAISSNEIEKILSGASYDDTYIDIPEVSCSPGVDGSACKESCHHGCKNSFKAGERCPTTCKEQCSLGCKAACISGNK